MNKIGWFEQLKLYPFGTFMTGVFIVAIAAGLYNFAIGNMIGTMAFFVFLICGIILGNSFFEFTNLNWVIKLMFASWLFCLFVAITELMGIWPILVSVVVGLVS